MIFSILLIGIWGILCWWLGLWVGTATFLLLGGIAWWAIHDNGRKRKSYWAQWLSAVLLLILVILYQQAQSPLKQFSTRTSASSIDVLYDKDYGVATFLNSQDPAYNQKMQNTTVDYQLAESSIQTLLISYKNAGGAQGWVKGSIATIEGWLGIGSASGYTAEAATTVTALSNGTTDSYPISPDRLNFFKELIPRLTDTPTVAQEKLNDLQALLSARLNVLKAATS